MSIKVAILGGGVAGMSAAHELIERGFDVEVYEKQHHIPGGKARSVPVPDTGSDGRKPLPAEHGFRFFPGFYKHVTDTMRRIPYPGNKRGVLDNLVESTKMMMARFDQAPISSLTRFPKSLAELKFELQSIETAHLGLTKQDTDTFAEKVWQLMTSCRERRVEDYERVSWWDYLDADRQSDAYRTYFATGLTRTLVAAKAKHASTKTGGDIYLQLVFNMADPSVPTDRVLNGPTNDVWIDPWLAYLKKQGVAYHFGTEVHRIECDDSKIVAAWVSEHGGPQRRIVADYFIAAVPVEAMARLLTDDLLKLDPTLKSINPLSKDVAWMNGMQFYLKRRVDINRGHVIYADSPWALTSISQPQFWPDFEAKDYGDGNVEDILSVDISDWCTKGLNGDRARDSKTKKDLFDQVWAQLQRSLNVDGKDLLRDEDRVTEYLDGDIVFGATSDSKGGCQGDVAFDPDAKWHNEEPLLVNRVNTWSLRPEAHTRIPNLFLASDYVRTYTDLATMEGANEAARRAVNGIISVSGKRAPFCRIWSLHEPLLLAPFRWYDRRRFKRGLPWKENAHWLFTLIHVVLRFVHRILPKK